MYIMLCNTLIHGIEWNYWRFFSTIVLIKIYISTFCRHLRENTTLKLRNILKKAKKILFFLFTTCR